MPTTRRVLDRVDASHFDRTAGFRTQIPATRACGLLRNHSQQVGIAATLEPPSSHKIDNHKVEIIRSPREDRA